MCQVSLVVKYIFIIPVHKKFAADMYAVPPLVAEIRGTVTYLKPQKLEIWIKQIN